MLLSKSKHLRRFVLFWVVIAGLIVFPVLTGKCHTFAFKFSSLDLGLNETTLILVTLRQQICGVAFSGLRFAEEYQTFCVQS